MPVIARDAVASDHLVYAWPFPIGPEEYEVACADDELVVMCPAWMVGDRLGPGRHRWRTPDPTRPASAFFVLTAPVEVSFDMITQFVMPTSGLTVRLRASGSLQVRCLDPALLVAQFVGLPFDHVNDGVLRSVSRSIERMLGRLLTRRVLMAGTPAAVTDPQMLPGIVEELVAYNPAAGAVFGVELVRFGHMAIAADDGSRPWQHLTTGNGVGAQQPASPEPDLLETVRAKRPQAATVKAPAVPPPPGYHDKPTLPPPIPAAALRQPSQVSGEIGGPQAVSGEIGPKVVSGEIGGGNAGRAASSDDSAVVSGEIGAKSQEKTTAPGHAAAPATATQAVPPPPAPPVTRSSSSPGIPDASRSLDPNRPIPTPAPRRAASIEVPASTDEITQPGVDIIRTPLPGSLQAPTSGAGAPIESSPSDSAPASGTPPPPEATESRGSIIGIGVAPIGSSGVASGEITQKIAPGGRVLVPGPNGLMQSATVRQLLQGYYELEVGGSGETIWVPVSGVVPE
jgi:hypothetical protein